MRTIARYWVSTKRGEAHIAEVIAADFNGTDRMGIADVGAYAFGSGSNPGWTLNTDFKPVGTTPPPMTDAGAPTSDAGTIVPGTDAGPPTGGPDSGGGPTADGGTADPPGDGCSCHVTGRSNAPMAPWLFATLLGSLLLRRRRVRRTAR